MKNTKSIFSHLILCLFFLVTACSTTVDPSEAYKGESAEQIFKHGEDALRDKDYSEAVKRFEALDVQYPFGRNTETAQLHIIYAYYRTGDYPSAEAAADRFIHSHPTNPHIDYAYYMRGVSNYYQNMGVFERIFAVDFATRDLSQVKKSFNDFSELTQRYPQSPYAPAAHQYMIFLRNVLANHQLEVAKYYYDRGAYVAAANRASIVVEHYQEVPVVPDALILMAKSYHKLGLVDLQNQTLEVLRYNYPEPRYLDLVTDKALNDGKYVVVTPLERASAVTTKTVVVAPPQDTKAVAYRPYSEKTATGTDTIVNKLVKLIHSSKVLATSPQDEQTKIADVPKNTAKASQSGDAKLTKIAQRAETGNGARNGEGTTLGHVLEKMGTSKLFALNSKKIQKKKSNVMKPEVVMMREAKNNIPAIPSNGTR